MDTPNVEQKKPEVPKKKRTFWQRVRRWGLRVFLFGLAICIICIITYLAIWYDNHTDGKKKYATVTATLDAKDPNWRFEKLIEKNNAEVAPKEKNVTLLAIEAHEEYERKFPKQEFPEGLFVPVWTTRQPNVSIDKAEMKLFYSQANHLDSSIKMLQPAKTMTEGGFPIDMGKDPWPMLGDSLTAQRTAAALLRSAAFKNTFEKNPKAALDHAHAILNIGSAMNTGDSTAIYYIVRSAIITTGTHAILQTLAWCDNANEEQLNELQQKLLREAKIPLYQRAMCGERALGARLFEVVVLGNNGTDKSDLRIPNGLEGFHYYQHVYYSAADLLERLTLPIENSELKAEAPPRCGSDWIGIAMYKHRIAGTAFPAVSKMAEVATQYKANCLCAAAGIAAERFRIKNKRWPESKEDWRTVINFDELIDPYDRQPIRYAKKPDGFVIYCVGTNMTDNGGDINFADSKNSLDLGFQLWNPEQRRMVKTIVPAEVPHP